MIFPTNIFLYHFYLFAGASISSDNIDAGVPCVIQFLFSALCLFAGNESQRHFAGAVCALAADE